MSKANKKIGKANMNMSAWMVMIMLAMITGNPTIAGIPGLFEVINKTKEKAPSGIESESIWSPGCVEPLPFRECTMRFSLRSTL